MPSPALGQVPFLRSRLRVTARPSGSAWAFFASLRFSKLHRGRAAREPSRRSQRPKLFPRAAECMMCWVSLRTIHSQDFLHGRPCTATKVMHHALRSCAGPSESTQCSVCQTGKVVLATLAITPRSADAAKVQQLRDSASLQASALHQKCPQELSMKVETDP